MIHTTGYELPVPSTSLDGAVEVRDLDAGVTISFDFWRDGKKHRGAIEFRKVRAYRFRAEIHCTAEQVEDAYDTLVEVKESSWAAEIRADTEPRWRNTWVLRHFMIYFDSDGCYELLADAWEASEVEV
jgi:hypothetical protein